MAVFNVCAFCIKNEEPEGGLGLATWPLALDNSSSGKQKWSKGSPIPLLMEF
jgi:hypothetical protein